MTVGAALRAATIALFATAALAAAPSTAVAQDLSCEPGDLEVRGLEFRGNRAISDDELAMRVTVTPSSRARRLHLPFGEKRCLNRAELPRDMARLVSYYENRGYYSARIDTLVQSVSDAAVRVIFLVDEGEPTRLASYAITGLEDVEGGADILRRLQLRVGDPFDVQRFAADIDTIISRLRNAGYYRADQVRGHDLDTTAAGRRADAFITVLPGQRARFGPPVFYITPVEGREVQIDTSVVRRVFGIPTGAWYSDRAIVEAQRNLFQLGTYRHIEVAPLPDSMQFPGDTIVILGARLTEDLMRQLDSEFGWATLDCGRVRLQYTDKNLFGTARRLELSGQASKIGYGEPVATPATRDACTFGGQSALAEDAFSDRMYYLLGLTLRQPRLLGTRWVPTLSVYSERRGEFKAFRRSTVIGADFSATREIGDRMPLRLGYAFEYGRTEASDAAFCALFNRCDEASRRTIEDLLPLGVASATLSRLRTDNPISPTRGTLMRGQFRTSASPLLGTSDSLFFNKITGDVAWYTSFSPGNVFTARLRGGVVLGRQLSLSDDAFVPPQERLYAGGPTSVRGFQQNELGAVVYIARTAEVDVTEIVTGADTTFRYEAVPSPTGELNPERAVPLGGNTLLVTNLEYRIRDPFLAPNFLHYIFFVDGGAVGSSEIRLADLKWTPGFGLRLLTPVGPVQVNVGYNGYARTQGPLFYNPDVNSLACATPGNQLTYRRNPANNQLEQVGTGACSDFRPPRRKYWYQNLTFTFSIGPEF